MTDAGSIDLRRYRRRVLGWGLVVLIVGFAVPAAFALDSVQNDLETRVSEALAEAGIDGVDVSFSGQDGTLRCAAPFTDPADEVTVVDVAGGVDGVRTIEVDASCTADAGGADAGGSTAAVPTEVAPDDTTPPTGSAPEPSAATTTLAATVPADPTVPTVPDEETIADVVAADPQFSQLASLLVETGLDDTLDVGGPFTLLAPSDQAFDEAFEALGADAFQELVSDPDRLRSVLLHHVTPGAIPSDALEPGPLTMLDGGTVTVERSPDGELGFRSGGVLAGPVEPAQLDIEAANGVIHAIDQVLPGSVIVDGQDDAAPGVVVELGTGRIVLGGSVASTAQRGVLLSAAQAVVPDDDLLDELVVDVDAATTDPDVERAAAMMPTFPDQLISGLLTVDVNGVRLTGVVADQVARVAVESLAASQGVQVDLTVLEQPDAAPSIDVEELQRALDDLVGESPIGFEADSTEFIDAGDAVVADVADLLGPVPGVDPTVRVTIIGHTDSAGDADRNLLLSEGRALRVRDALVELGVAPGLLVGVGRGETELVVDDDGVEDPAASRRVEFLVERVAEAVT